jgi:hypothetical protein
MKPSCIHHPEHEPLVILRRWQVDFCDGDHCAAALLSHLEYWHNIKLDQCAQAGILNPSDADLIQHHTTEQLRDGILGLYDAKAIRAARRLLVEKGAITEHRNPILRYFFDRTIHFVYHPKPVNAWLDAHHGRSEAAPAPAPVATIPAPILLPTPLAVAMATPLSVPAIPTPVAAAPTGETTGPCGVNADSCGEIADSSPEITSELSKTTPPTPPEPDRVGRGGGGALIFDFYLANFPEDSQKRAEQMLWGLEPNLAQQVLDEWNVARSGGKVREPWAWLRTVGEQARRGAFIPTNELRERRLAAAVREAIRASAGEVAPAAAQRRPSAVWRQCQVWLQGKVESLDFNRYITTLRGREDGQALWLEAPNRFVAAWVGQRLGMIEEFIRPHAPLEVRVCVG